MNNAQYNFTEDIDYLNTGDKSIWGVGDIDTLKILAKRQFNGTWVNLAAGDVRYNNILLSKADKVIATDLDVSALEKLKQTTPKQFSSKLSTEQVDLLKRFPFKDGFADGVFSTGTFHLFPKEKIKIIFDEISRVLRQNGQIFIDFATDIKRELPNGNLLTFPNEESYELNEAKNMIKNMLSNFEVKLIDCFVPPEEVVIEDLKYMFSCHFFIIDGYKK